MESSADCPITEKRNRSIKGAVITSIFSKFGTLILRLISIPIAIELLGIELFGVYTTILVLVQMIDILHVGIGPTLTQKLSKAVLANDKESEARLFSTGMIISAMLTISIGIVLMLIAWNVPITEIFGDKYSGFSDTMRRAFIIGIILISVELISLVAERARDGYMETRYTNSWGAGANLLGAIFLLAGIWKFPTIEFLLIAVNGTIIAGKFGNMVHMMCQRPYLIPRIRTFTPQLIKPLMAGCLTFTIVYGLSGIIEYNGLAYLIGRYLGPANAGNYSILITLHVSLVGIISMLTIPMWPALIDAYERKDFKWVKNGAKKLRIIAISFGVATIVGMSLFGPWAMRKWVGEQFELGRSTLVIFAVYFSLHLWRHVNQILCLGLSQERKVSYVVLGEVTLVLISALIVLNSGSGIQMIFLTMSLAIMGMTAWLYPTIYQRSMQRDVSAHHCEQKRLDPEPVQGRTIV